jgi:preprotein translocase subunit SecG
MSVLIGILTAIHVLVALFLIVLVLMQKSSDQGIGAAFGGGVTETVFGAGTTTALVRMTIWCACIMLGTTLLLAILHTQRGGGRESLMQKAVQSGPAMPGPAASQPPAMPVETTASTPAAPGPTTPAPASEKPAETNP